MTEKTRSGLTLAMALEAFARDVIAIKDTPRQLFIKASADYFTNEGAPWEDYQTFLSRIHDHRLKSELMKRDTLLWKGKDERFRLVAARKVQSAEIFHEGSCCAFCGLVEEDSQEMVAITTLRVPIRGAATAFVHADCEYPLREKLSRSTAA